MFPSVVANPDLLPHITSPMVWFHGYQFSRFQEENSSLVYVLDISALDHPPPTHTHTLNYKAQPAALEHSDQKAFNVPLVIVLGQRDCKPLRTKLQQLNTNEIVTV